jgi:hypothetical protein
MDTSLTEPKRKLKALSRLHVRPTPPADGHGHAPYRLTREIIARSVATSWSEAKGEWELEYAVGRNWLNCWEVGFYRGCRGRQQLRDRQLARRVEVNRAVLGHVRREGLADA